MTELTEQDKQRIEDFITKLGWDEKGTAEFNDMMKVAEYATRYERRPTCGSCHKGKVNSQGECDFCGAHAVLVALMPKPDVEAERTELRNKVIDECIEVLMKADLLEINLAYEKLNSLKTK